MKNKLTFLMLIMVLSCFTSWAQSAKELSEIKVTPPKFTGIIPEKSVPVESKFTSLEKFLVMQIDPMLTGVKKFREGTAIIQFTVDQSGEVSDFVVVNSVTPEVDNEVIKALKTTNGMWKPGLNNDELVAMDKEVAISFRLENTTQFENRVKTIYKRGAKMLYVKHRPEKALKQFDACITLVPNDKGTLINRGLAKYELNDFSGACKDWNRIKSLGGVESEKYLENFCDMKGYAELVKILGDQ